MRVVKGSQRNKRTLHVVQDYHDICRKCVPETYEKFDDMTGSSDDAFQIPCSFIQRDDKLLNPKLLKLLTEEEQKMALGLMNAVAWAEQHLVNEDGTLFSARDYQEEFLRCSAKYIVGRAGRGVGKCLTGNTRIFTRSGAYYPIKDLINKTVEGQGIDPESHTILRRQKIYITENIIQPVIKITTISGKEIEVSLEHPFLTRFGWLEAGKLQIGQRIATPATLSWDGVLELPDHFVKLIAYGIADGGLTSGGVRITNQNPLVIDELRAIAKSFDLKLTSYDITHNLALKKTGRGIKNPAIEMFRELGLMNQGSHKKSIPQSIFRLRRPQLITFLQRLFACDGWASVSKIGKRNSVQRFRAEIGYASVNKRLAQDVQHLLLRFGIHSDLCWKKTSKPHGIYQVVIRQITSISRFIEYIGIFSKEEAVMRVRDFLGKKFSILDPENVVWESIVDIQKLEDQMTYSVSVDNQVDYDLKNFVANDIYSHNTAALVVRILFEVFKADYQKVIIFGPQKVHVEELHDRILGFIERSPTLRSSKDRSVKSPIFEITLTNGSRIRGFASGDSSNSSGLSLRGQDAHLIVLDEAAYINRETIDQAVMPLIQRFPHVKLIATSTPSGNKDKFYEWSMTDPKFKEFYWPSSVLPHWDQVKDDIAAHYRDNKDAYLREIMAMHGVSQDGVYRADLVNKTLKDFKYEDMIPEKDVIYSMGVDWNKTVGTEIVLVGYNRFTGKWRVGPCVNIPKQELTQHVALEKIVELTNLWKPHFMYMDEGYGSTQIEMLKKRGLESVPLDGWQHKLYDIVKGYNFSARLDVRDPNTGEIIKKDAKPFMVENSVRRFEEEQLEISVHDSLLQRQLGNYVVKSRSVTGRPVYGCLEKKLGDHRLDAMNLALVAYKLEMSDFSPNAPLRVAVKPQGLGLEELNAVYRIDAARESSVPEERTPRVQGPVLTSVLGGAVPVYRHGFLTDTEVQPPRNKPANKPVSSRMSVPSRRT